MIRRLLLVLQSISLIPPIGMFFFWGKYIFTDWNTGFLEIVSIHLLSFIPFTLLFLGKYIVYGKFYIFKNEEGEEKTVRRPVKTSVINIPPDTNPVEWYNLNGSEDNQI